MRVTVLFFGVLKDIVGSPSEELRIDDGSDLGSVFEHYCGRFPRLREMAGSIVLARNREFAGPATPAGEGDEIAFLPPVSGGCGAPGEYLAEISESGNFYALTRHAIETRPLAECLLRGEDGAMVTFEGVVRNNTRGRATRFLEYEGYESMALAKMAEIGREIAASFAVDHLAMVHRLGRLLIGETSVAVIVSAAHRRPAFDAALEGINRLKRLVPIWKKEYFADGEVWVEGEWDANAPVVRRG